MSDPYQAIWLYIHVLMEPVNRRKILDGSMDYNQPIEVYEREGDETLFTFISETGDSPHNIINAFYPNPTSRRLYDNLETPLTIDSEYFMFTLYNQQEDKFKFGSESDYRVPSSSISAYGHVINHLLKMLKQAFPSTVVNPKGYQSLLQWMDGENIGILLADKYSKSDFDRKYHNDDQKNFAKSYKSLAQNTTIIQLSFYSLDD